MPFQLGSGALVAMIAFIAISVVVGAVGTSSGGWRIWAAKYPAPALPPDDERRFRFASMRTSGGGIRSARYGSVVNVGVGRRGISLSIWAPFSFLHPPMLIPWEAVEQCEAGELFGHSSAKVTLAAGGSFTVFGDAADAIAAQHQQVSPRF